MIPGLGRLRSALDFGAIPPPPPSLNALLYLVELYLRLCMYVSFAELRLEPRASHICACFKYKGYIFICVSKKGLKYYFYIYLSLLSAFLVPAF